MKEFLVDLGLESSLAEFISTYAGVLALATIFLLTPLFTIWIERKVAARFQMRIGPNRVGPWGLIQNIADVVKLLGKELILPRNVDFIPFMLAPIIMVVSVLLITAVIPITPDIIGTDMSVGALYFVAVASVASIAVVMAGWGSNNKYALLGAFRTVAQLLSYEVPMVLALLVPVLLAGTMSMQGIVEFQEEVGFMFLLLAPTAAILFLVSSVAEIGRAPFDLIEAESELVAGFMIEYSGMAFAMFYLAEFLHAFLVAMLTAVLFLGGWSGPFVHDVDIFGFHILGFVYLSIKTLAVYFLMLWARMTLPRFRIDHLMNFNWKFMVPLSVANLLLVAFLWKFLPEIGIEVGNTFGESLPTALIMFFSSITLLIVALLLLRNALQPEESVAVTIVEQPSYAVTTTETAPSGD
jgi:NADH-quinone oxidoreductase subunit H